MIISRPKGATLFSLGMFLLIAYGALYFLIADLLKSETWPWFLYVLLSILAPLALVITAKVLLGYKIISIEKGYYKVKYPFKFSRKEFLIQDLKLWEETVIKTKSGVYKELKLSFPDKATISLSNHENENYEEILKYVAKRHPKQKVSS